MKSSLSSFPKYFTFYSHTKHITDGENWEENYNINCRVFSNLYPCSIEIDSILYSSSETYFQQYKYSQGDKNFFFELTSMGDVAAFGQRRLILRQKHLKIISKLKEKGKEYPLKPDGNEYTVKDKASPKLCINDWDIEKIPVMYVALRAKFNQHKNLQESLLNTGDSWLIEHTKNDKQWADGLHGNGMNYLGKLLMLIRNEIRNQSSPHPYSLENVKQNITFDYEYLRKPMTNFLSYPLYE